MYNVTLLNIVHLQNGGGKTAVWRRCHPVYNDIK